MFTLAAQSSPVNGIVLVLIYALIFGGFWFLFIRPQKKEQKRVQARYQKGMSVEGVLFYIFLILAYCMHLYRYRKTI